MYIHQLPTFKSGIITPIALAPDICILPSGHVLRMKVGTETKVFSGRVSRRLHRWTLPGLRHGTLRELVLGFGSHRHRYFDSQT